MINFGFTKPIKTIEMEENKNGCKEIQAELDEYKELLWQLSDEYKENVGAAEKRVAEEVEKRLELEKEIRKLEKQLLDKKVNEGFGEKKAGTDIHLLGLPACIFDENGNIIDFNNKFKFFVELLSFDIEEIQSIKQFTVKLKNTVLQEKVNSYFKSDKNILQAVFSTVNSFKKQVHIILRIYRNEWKNEHLALWIELQNEEINSIQPSGVLSGDEEFIKRTEIVSSQDTNSFDPLIADIRSYAKRYEISSQLLSFINKKINKKAENLTLIREIYNKIEKTFNLKKEAVLLLKRIEQKEKDFIKRLKEKYPELTANEQKHCLLIREGLTYKEIAALMEITVNGVKIARNRLRKKLNLDGDIKTSDFITDI